MGGKMTKQEFMTELQRALNGRMGSAKAAPHVAYYQEYIEIEMRKGRAEEEVLEELGSPRLLAKSIGDVSDKEAPDAPYGVKLSRRADRMALFGAALGKECARFCVKAVGNVKKWMKR